MIFVINNLKYDTDRMELISSRCKWMYKSTSPLLAGMRFYGKDVLVYKSKKGNWLLMYREDFSYVGVALNEQDAKYLLMKYDIEAYEKIFGELEEA